MSNRCRVTVVCFVSFIVLGIANSILGPTLRDLAAGLNLPLSAAGILRSAQQIGLIIGTLISGRVLDRRSPRDVMLPGVLLMGIGLLGLANSSSALAGIITSVVVGIGFGLLNVGANVTIGTLYEANAGPPLAALHTFFGIGLFCGPLLAGWTQTITGDWRTVYVIAAALFAGVAVWLTFSMSSEPMQAKTTPSTKNASSRPPIVWILLLPLMSLIFLYNGAGNGISDWLPTHLELAVHVSIPMAAQITSLYGLALTAGRLLSIEGLRKFGNMRVLAVAVGVAALGAAFILFGGQQIGVVTAGVVMIGVGFGPIYPTVIAIGGQQQPQNFSSVTAILAESSATGALIIPALQGQVGNGQDGGLGVTFVAALIMIVSLVLIYFTSKRQLHTVA